MVCRGRAKKPARAQREDYAEQRELKSLSSHGRRFFHKTLPGLPIYPVLSAGFIRDIKEALLFSSMTRSCVASVAVVPIIFPEIKPLSGRLFPCVFSATCRKENTHGKRSRNARDNTVLIYL